MLTVGMLWQRNPGKSYRQVTTKAAHIDYVDQMLIGTKHGLYWWVRRVIDETCFVQANGVERLRAIVISCQAPS